MVGSRPQSHVDAISMENSLDYCCTLLPTATRTWTTTAAAAAAITTTATTTNKSTARTVLHK